MILLSPLSLTLIPNPPKPSKKSKPRPRSHEGFGIGNGLKKFVFGSDSVLSATIFITSSVH